jgi:hypothetical protein
MLAVAMAPAFLRPRLSLLIGIVIIGARDETLRHDAMAVVADNGQPTLEALRTGGDAPYHVLAVMVTEQRS